MSPLFADLLGLAIRGLAMWGLPVGTAYAVWTGIGAIGILGLKFLRSADLG